MNYFDVLLAKKLEDTRDPVVKGLSVTENGRYSEENTVYDVVVVDVPETRLTTLNATANGTYTPQEGEAYNEVNVDVPLPSNAYLLKSLTGLPQDIATFTDGADAPLNALTASIELSCAGADIIVSESEIINNKTPYLFRKSAGGNRVLEKLIGGTIVTNQMIENGDFSDGLNGWTILNEGASTITASNNEATITGNTTYNDGVVIELQTTPGHIYYVTASIKSAGNVRFHDGQNIFTDNITSSSDYKRCEHIISVGTLTSQFFILSKQSINTVNIKNVMCIDITRVFGDGAQYIYGLEQSTAGAGVAYFRQMFPSDYYAYDTGSLQSVNVASKKVVGKNLLPTLFTTQTKSQVTMTVNSDGTLSFSGTASLLDGFYSTFTLRKGSYLFTSGADESFSTFDTYLSLSGTTIARGGNDKGNAFTLTEDSTVTVSVRVRQGTNMSGVILYPMIRFSTITDGTYEPYEEHAYAFDSDLTLRGIPKLDASNNLYYDGDVYESDGSVTRKYGVVDLGSLTWTYSTSDKRWNATLTAMKTYTGRSGNIVFEKYTTDANVTTGGENKGCASGNYILIYTSDNTNTPTGLCLYELATPTTESADTYINPQIVDADGTEEFVDYAYSQSTRDVAVPVGHDSYYYDGTLYSRDFPATISSGSYDIINGVITSGQNTYNTTPLPLRSLVGNNNIYVDCGEITNLEYFTKEQHE